MKEFLEEIMAELSAAQEANREGRYNVSDERLTEIWLRIEKKWMEL